MRPIDAQPTTNAEVFEMLHGLFGIGDYADDDPIPWHKMRMTEISKIGAISKKRRLAPEDFAMLARYAVHHGKRITKTWDLLQFYGPALRERAAEIRQRPDQSIEAAVEAERAIGDALTGQWVDRLYLARGDGQRAVLQEWAAARGIP